MKACPKCGCKRALIREFSSGYGEVYLNLETGETDYSSIYEGLVSKRVRKYWVCSKCQTKLFRDNPIEINKALEEEDSDSQ